MTPKYLSREAEHTQTLSQLTELRFSSYLGNLMEPRFEVQQITEMLSQQCSLFYHPYSSAVDDKAVGVATSTPISG